MLKAIIFYCQFFTAIPLPIAIDEPVRRFREGIIWFSVASLIYSLIIGLSYGIFRFGFSVSTSLVLVGFLDVMLTNAFHFDALADMADGIFSGQKKARMLEIMKDSRIGSNGTVALIFYFLLFVFVHMEYMSGLPNLLQEVNFLISLYLVGRGAMVFSFRNYKYHSQTKDGLGAILQHISTKKILIGQVIFVLLIVLFVGYMGVVAYLLILGLTELYRRFIYKKIGGYNGDTTGTICLLAQIAYLLLMTLLT